MEAALCDKFLFSCPFFFVKKLKLHNTNSSGFLLVCNDLITPKIVINEIWKTFLLVKFYIQCYYYIVRPVHVSWKRTHWNLSCCWYRQTFLSTSTKIMTMISYCRRIHNLIVRLCLDFLLNEFRFVFSVEVSVNRQSEIEWGPDQTRLGSLFWVLIVCSGYLNQQSVQSWWLWWQW